MPTDDTVPLALVAAWVVVLGATVGSFLNVVIARVPAGLSIVRPRSRCPRCGHAIAWYDNVPILSWLLLRARCRGCALSISWQYPLVELTVAIAWVTAVWHFGPTLTALRLGVAFTLLLGVVMTDLQHYVIPDGFTLTGFLVGILMPPVAMVLGDAGPFAGPWDALIGAFAGAGLIAITAWLGEIAFKKEAMGQGDVTLMAMIGAMVGPGRGVLTVFLAAAIGALSFLLLVVPIGAMRAKRAGVEFEPPLVPFGVFLAPAGLVALLWGDALIAAYLSYSGL